MFFCNGEIEHSPLFTRQSYTWSVLPRLYDTGILIVLPFQIHSTQGINLGLISGDTKRHCGPVVIKKYSHKSPVVINIHSIPLISPLTIPKIPSKPPPLKLSEPIRSLLPIGKPLFPWPGPMLPLIPKLPFIPTLPIIPSILPAPLIVPPLLPRRTLPLLPSFLPIVAPLPHISIPFLPKPSHTPMKPLKIPIIGKKSLLQKALDSEIRKVTLPSHIQW